LRIKEKGTKNTESYNDAERIRIAGIDAPEINTPGGLKAKQSLSNKISGKTVLCTVQARDTYGRVVATVKTV